MKTILALIDFSDVSARVLQQTETYAKVFGSHVVLMHVVPPDPVVVDFAPVSTALEDLQATKAELLTMRDSLASLGLSAEAVSSQGSIVETIAEWIRRHQPDFIIMGSHGHGALYNLFVGSVTAGVLKKAMCPVLVIPSLPAKA